MAIPYHPTTELGTGFLVPIIKSTHHIHAITLGLAHGWPITREQAKAEIDHAILHAEGLRPAKGIITKTCEKYLNDWQKQVVKLRDAIQALENDNPEGLLSADDPLREQMKDLEKQTWGLLSALDTELLGWHADATDPGAKP